MDAIRLADVFARITEAWSPRVVAAVNGQHVRAAVLRGGSSGTPMRTKTNCST